MKTEKGGTLTLLLILIVAIIICAEYYVSNGKPFSNFLKPSNRSYQTFEEHEVQKERDKRTSELKKKIMGFFGFLKG